MKWAKSIGSGWRDSQRPDQMRLCQPGQGVCILFLIQRKAIGEIRRLLKRISSTWQNWGGECLLSILSRKLHPSSSTAFSVSFPTRVKLFHFPPCHPPPPQTPSSLALVYLFSAPLAEDSPLGILFLFSTLLLTMRILILFKMGKVQVSKILPFYIPSTYLSLCSRAQYLFVHSRVLPVPDLVELFLWIFLKGPWRCFPVRHDHIFQNLVHQFLDLAHVPTMCQLSVPNLIRV